MGKGKLKYRDVVKKPKFKEFKKKQKPRKTYSLYKKDFERDKGKRKLNDQNKEETETKRAKVEEEPVESSESEDEPEDHMKQLRETFGSTINSKLASAIESEDELEEEEEVMEETEGVLEEEIDSSEEDSGDEVESDSDHAEPERDESKDPFIKHIQYEINDSLLSSLQTVPVQIDSYQENWKMGKLFIQIPKCEVKEQSVGFSIEEQKQFAPCGEVPKKLEAKMGKLPSFYIKPQIVPNLKKANKCLPSSAKNEFFTPFQSELFSIVNNYQDFYFNERNFDNAEEIRFVYCLHAVNHILKTRLKVIHHNARLSKRDDVPEEFRDQGLVRPKVLMIVPFKSSAYKIVHTLIELILTEDKGNVMNKLRFNEDYTGNELILPKKNPKPEDYEQIFSGNTSDDFKIGITVTKKSIKLYADFYSSDIIIASPLGLRTLIGAEGEPERDFDFLASIELLILDQTELFLMQNWDHILHIFNHLHLQPKDSHGTDFSRVRTWSLNGWAKYYRQTLIFSSITLPEINSLFNKRCLNYAGKVKLLNLIEIGCISQVFVQLPHVFHKFEASNVVNATEERFSFFLDKILPQQRDSMMKQTLIFLPSYFDYVKLRNYFKREDIGFTQICEYSKEGKVARARDMFFHGDSHFMLYTERYHFFHRIRLKGIRHLVFYQPPNFPHFYYEMCNLMQEGNMNRKIGNMSNMTVTVLYSKYDACQLAAIVGSERASKMLNSDKKVHMMLTGTD